MNKIFKVFAVFILIMAFSTNVFAKIGYNRLSQLIHSAPYIAKGKISLQNDIVILDIEKMLKGQAQSQLTISFLHDFEAPDPVFNDGEEVILFLHIPDFGEGYIIPGLGTIPMPEIKEGEIYLFGLGDQGKWPKRYSKKINFMPYPKLQDTASIKEIQYVVEKILKIEDSNNIDEKTKLCLDYIKSSNKLLKYTTMEYALDGGIWTSQEKTLNWLGDFKKHKNIITKFRNEILELNLINDDEPTIRSEAIRFFNFAEPYEIVPLLIPILIPKITDSDRLVRSVTRDILNQFARNHKTNGDFTNFKPEDSIENLNEVQKQWNEWWQENKDNFTKTK